MSTACKLLMIATLSCVAATADVISLQPAVNSVGVGETFSLDVSIIDTTDLYGYQFDIGFNPSLISAIVVTEGPFLPNGGATTFFPGIIDNIGGTITFTAGILNTALTGVSGSGVLASIQFTALASGSSSIGVFNALALDSFGQGKSVTTSGATLDASSVPEPPSLFLVAATVLVAAARGYALARTPSAGASSLR